MTHKIDKYQVIEQLGSGTTGVVYLARDLEIQRLVAIKVIKAEFFGDESTRSEAVKRFSAEIKAIGRLSHPNIVSLYDSGVTIEGFPFLVMQYVEGKGLDLIIRDCDGALDTKRALKVLKQIASAVDYFHSEKVVHRDIKPSNILIARDDHAYMLDFSTALVGDEQFNPSQTGQVIGTPQFMAPEVIRGEQATEASDIFSLGVMAFLLFTGKRPFREGDVSDTFSSTLRHSALSFVELNCNLGAKLERVLRRALSKDAPDRYSSGLEFISACEKALGSPQQDIFSQVAPALDTHDPANTGVFKIHTKEALRRQGNTASNLIKSIFILFLIIVFTSATTIAVILLGLDKDSIYNQMLRQKLGLGYKVTDLKNMTDSELIQFLSSNSTEESSKLAIFEANQRDTEDLANTVSTLVSDPRREVRIEAVKALGQMKSLPVQTRDLALARGVKDEDPFIRIFSATELVKFKVESAKEIIAKQRELEQDVMVAKVLDFVLENCEDPKNPKKKK